MIDASWDDGALLALGVVVDDDRGSLPYTLVHGEALVAAAAWALGEAGVTLLDLTVPWESVREAEEPFVLHDSLCPLTPPDFIARCVASAHESGAVVVGVRPDDTPPDLPSSAAVWSPVVLPAAVAAGLDRRPGPDLAALVADLRADHEVLLIPAPPSAMRVGGPDDVRRLEALTTPDRGPDVVGSDFHSRNSA